MAVIPRFFESIPCMYSVACSPRPRSGDSPHYLPPNGRSLSSPTRKISRVHVGIKKKLNNLHSSVCARRRAPGLVSLGVNTLQSTISGGIYSTAPRKDCEAQGRTASSRRRTLCDGGRYTWDLWLMIRLVHVRPALTRGYFLSSFVFTGSTDGLHSSPPIHHVECSLYKDF